MGLWGGVPQEIPFPKVWYLDKSQHSFRGLKIYFYWQKGVSLPISAKRNMWFFHYHDYEPNSM